MSLDLTEDEFRDCYWKSAELKEIGSEYCSGYYYEYNTDLHKELIQKALSSKTR
jgi:hypothetical protein